MGFALKEECTVYTEAEDELDGVVRNRRDGKATDEDEGPEAAIGGVNLIPDEKVTTMVLLSWIPQWPLT